MRRSNGFTIVEMLIALAVIAVAFAALAYTQVNNLHATSRSRLSTETKTEATKVLEDLEAKILAVDESGTDGTMYDDDPRTNLYRSFSFIDYYYGCPTFVDPPSATTTEPAVRGGDYTHLKFYQAGDSLGSAPSECSGTVNQAPVQDGTVTSTWSITGLAGTDGEGLIDVKVSATHDNGGPTILLEDRLSCFNISPSPTVDVPVPCPVPTTTGGGR